MNEQTLEDYLIYIVMKYGGKWNEIEDNIYKLHEQEEEELKLKFQGDDYYYVKRTDWFAKFSSFITPLFDEFCTDKNRVYGGKNRTSFGFPLKFAGIEKPVETSVILKNKNRAEVFVKTDTNCSDEFLFILLKKAGLWKIDSYKNRRYRSEKWSLMIL